MQNTRIPPTKTRLEAVFATLSTAWLLLATVEVGLLTLVPSSAFHDQHFTLVERLSLVAFDLRALALFLVVLAAPAVAVHALGRAYPGTPGWLRLAASLGGVFLVWALLFLYGVSWGAFWSSGTFLDRAAIGFWRAQPIQVFHWAPPRLLYGIPALSLAVTVLLCRWGPHWLERSSRTSLRWPSALATASLLVSVAAAASEQPGPGRAELVVTDANTGIAQTLAARYEEARRFRSGAFAHGLVGLIAWGVGDEVQMVAANDIEIVRRPLISMKQYLSRADGGAVRSYNVLVILAESLRPDQLRIYGGPREVMPAVEALAREGRVFRRAYAQASHSNYADPCPLSSHYPLRSYGHHDYPPNPSYPRVMLYDVLKSRGYRVAFFSSQNENWGNLLNYWDTGSIDYLHHPGTWGGPQYVAKSDTGFAAWVAKTKHAGSIDDRYTVEEALKWVGQDSRPFFMYMNLQSSHFPYYVPDDHRRRFGPDRVDFIMTFGNYPREKVDVVKDLYADSLHYMDLQLAKLFDGLKARGLWDRTIVVLTGDQGQAFYEHGLAVHGNSLFEEAVRVALIVRAPELEPGIEQGPAQHIDVPPSVLHLLGLPPHPAQQGINLFAPDVPVTRSIFLVTHTPLATLYGIARDRHKLIWDARRRTTALYDLEADPGETRDRSLDEPEILRGLAKRLNTWASVQVEYYANRAHHGAWYPPVLREP